MIQPVSSLGSGIIRTTLLANLPQLVLTFLYFNYNNLFTSMLIAKEWNGYGSKRKPLRVTSPQGQQRSTYWLQLPFRYSVPLIIMSTLLHWFMSQSLFVIAVEQLGQDDNVGSLYSTCGYSPIAILFTIVLAGFCIVLSITFGLRRYDPSTPFVGSCSAAISAACHRPENDILAFERPVIFGKSHQKRAAVGGPYAGYSLTSFKLLPPTSASSKEIRKSKDDEILYSLRWETDALAKDTWLDSSETFGRAGSGP